MIERQVFCMSMLAAVLAAIAIADVDARPLHRRFAILAANVDVMPQPDN